MRQSEIEIRFHCAWRTKYQTSFKTEVLFSVDLSLRTQTYFRLSFLSAENNVRGTEPINDFFFIFGGEKRQPEIRLCWQFICGQNIKKEDKWQPFLTSVTSENLRFRRTGESNK